MLQWFISFPEFAEFTEILFYLVKTQLYPCWTWNRSPAKEKNIFSSSPMSSFVWTIQWQYLLWPTRLGWALQHRRPRLLYVWKSLWARRSQKSEVSGIGKMGSTNSLMSIGWGIQHTNCHNSNSYTLHNKLTQVQKVMKSQHSNYLYTIVHSKITHTCPAGTEFNTLSYTNCTIIFGHWLYNYHVWGKCDLFLRVSCLPKDHQYPILIISSCSIYMQQQNNGAFTPTIEILSTIKIPGKAFVVRHTWMFYLEWSFSYSEKISRTWITEINCPFNIVTLYGNWKFIFQRIQWKLFMEVT